MARAHIPGSVRALVPVLMIFRPKAIFSKLAPSISAEMTEIQSGTYISVWMMDGNVEAVKLKGTN